MQVSAVNVPSCSSKHVQAPIDDGHGLAEKPVRKDLGHLALGKRRFLLFQSISRCTSKKGQQCWEGEFISLYTSFTHIMESLKMFLYIILI